MTILYLIRHAEAEGNLYRRIHGWYDALITENGFRQIEALKQRFENIPVDAVYSSDLYRTMTTARAVYCPKGLQLHTDPRLREINMGDWEDETWGSARHFDSVSMDQFNHTDPKWLRPGGETFFDVANRLHQALSDIIHENPNRSVAVFSHGTAIRQVLAQLKNIPSTSWKDLPHCDNTAVTCLTFEDDHFQIVYEGDNSHLNDELSTLKKQSWWKKDSNTPEINLWFRPIDWAQERLFYLNARKDAWISTHGAGIPFDGDSFLRDAEEHLHHSPFGVTLAMSGEQVAGILQLDCQRYSQDRAGYIPFCYIIPELREQNLGIQLIGQAVSFFRPLGRDKLRLRCAPYNQRAQHFYQKYGFTKVGEESGSRVPLDILEKYIGYDR